MNAVATQRENRAVRENQPAEPRYMTPPVDIFENKDGYVLLAEMPGVTKEGLEVTLEGNTLMLAGHRTVDWPQAEVIFRESRPAHFRRVFELDPAIDTGKINARVEQGVLTLELPKTEQVKPRKITVG